MKNIRNTIKSVFFAVALLLLSSVTIHAASGFGIAPADFNVDFLQPGSTYTKSYLVSRSGDLSAMNVVIEPDMGEVNDWLTFSPSKRFTFAKGVSKMEFKVTINVPDTAEYKPYPGTFTLRAVPADAEIKGVTIAQGLQLTGDIVVTEEEIVRLEIKDITAEDIEFGKPVVIKVTGENLGNVDTTPTLKVKISTLQDELLEEHDVANLQAIKSGETSDVTGNFRTELEKGEYFMDVQAFLGEDLKYEKRLILNIVDKKAPVQAGTTKEDSLSSITSFIKENSTYFWIVLAAAGVGLLALILINVFWTSREREGKATEDTISVAGGSKQSTRIALSVAFGLLTTFALLVSSSSNIEPNEIKIIDRRPEVQGTSDSLNQPTLPRQPMLKVVESAVESTGTPFPVYESASIDSNVIYEAKDDEKLEVVKESGNWYQVKLYVDGIERDGWVSKSIVKYVTTKNQ